VYLHLNKTNIKITEMTEVYGIKNCNKIRDTLKWLDENDIDYKFIDIRKDPIEPEKLADYVHKVGLETILNRRGRKWKELGLSKKDLTDEELFDQLLQNQIMIKRPLIVKDEAVMVGYDEDAFENFFD